METNRGNRTQVTETDVRGLLHRRPTWMLLAVWEVTETIRDTHNAPAELVEAAVGFIDWTIDELDRRYPLVLIRFNAHDDRGRHLDLMEMYRAAYTEELAR